ncbi:DUF1149 family protein [Vagococcus acidifermentans]|uniref:DUF1149 family protein n=1 Tax=Vagococcus acidifermentans TaxID=564710 RepID=UPI000F85E4B9|nr:DUF1149 family protein [Vagococcus acidifermentans]
MEINRQKEFVNAFHYDALPKDHSEETAINVSVTPLPITKEMALDSDKDSIVGISVEFKIVLKQVLISGTLGQVSTLKNKKVSSNTDLAKEEIDLLVRPLLLMIERLTYEVTEIALDAPGIQLNFASNPQ